MVNWYIPLYLGVIFILFIFEYVGSSKRVDDYLDGTNGLIGLSWGTNLLLARIISCEVILFSIVAVEYFGLIGGILIISIEFISLIIVYYLILKINNNHFPERTGLVGLINYSLKAPDQIFFSVTIALYLFSNIFLQLYILRLLLGDTFQHYQFAAIFSVCIVSFISAGLGGFNALCKGARPLVIFIYFAITVITITIFLEKGLISTYKDLGNIPILSSQEVNTFFIIIAAIIWRTSHYLLDNSLWHIIRQIKPHRIKTILPISLLCILAIPLAFSSLAIFSKSQGLTYTDGAYNIFFILMNSPMFLTLYICLIFIITISTISTNLHGLVSIYLIYKQQALTLTRSDNDILKSGYFIGLFVLIFCLYLALTLNFSLIKYLNLVGIFYASLSVPFIRNLINTSIPKANYFIFFFVFNYGPNTTL
jgi:hypothetical protein